MYFLFCGLWVFHLERNVISRKDLIQSCLQVHFLQVVLNLWLVERFERWPVPIGQDLTSDLTLLQTFCPSDTLPKHILNLYVI